MLLLIFIIFSVLSTFLTCYFGQYVLNGKVIIWSIPLYLILYLFIAVVLFLIFVTFINLIIRPKLNKKSNKLHTKLTKLVSQFVLTICNCQVIVVNKDKIPKNTNFLMISNHQSSMDPITFIWGFRDIDCTFVMKKSLMKLPIIGKWLYGAGFLPIDRNNDRKALETINMAIKRIKNKDNSIGIYPEGTRSKGPIINHFHSGTFKIAQKAQCPIVLIASDNAYKIRFRSPFVKTKLYCEVVEVIPYEKIANMNTNEIAEYTNKRINDTLEKRREEISWLKPLEKYTKGQRILD